MEDSLKGSSDLLQVGLGRGLLEAGPNPLEAATDNLPLNPDERMGSAAAPRRVGRALRVVAACNEAMLRAADEATLLDNICRAIVHVGEYRMAWVGYAERDAQKSIRPIASSGVELGYLESVGFSWSEDSQLGRGPSGTSIRTGAPAIAADTQADPDFAPWRLEAQRRGYTSCISLPLTIGGAVSGVLVIYAAEADAFGKYEAQALAQAAGDLSFGINALRTRAEHARLRAALRRSEDWLRAALQGSLDALFLLRPMPEDAGVVNDFELLDVNARAEELLKVPRHKLVGRRFSSVFRAYHKELLPRYLRVLESAKAIEEQFSLSTPSGRTIWLRHQVVPIEEGIAVILRDITEGMTASQLIRDSEKNYRDLVESLQEGIWAADRDARTTFVNGAMAQMLGYAVGEMLGRSIFDFVQPRLHENLRRHRRLREQGVRERFEFEFQRKNGGPVHLEIEAAPRYDSAGTYIGTIAGVTDNTDRKRTERELRESLNNLAKAEELAQLGTWTYDRSTRRFSGSVEMRRLLGLPAEASAISTDFTLAVFHPHERAGATEDLARMLKGEVVRGERRILRPDGEERVLLFQSEPVMDETGRVVRVDGFAQDVTERKRNEARLEYLATHDALTDLPNRRVLEDRMAQAIAHLVRNPGDLLAVLYLDLNRFKFVNDSLGHSFGDELLKAVGILLKSLIREGDTVARQGGDEFIILLRDIRDPTDVMAVAEKIHEALEKPLLVEGRPVYATSSIGASLYPTDGEDIETLLKNADAAMYRAKQAGGGIQFYTRALSEHASERVQLESDLRRALEQGEFELHYQPQVAFADGHIVGAEALIRWSRPGAGLVLPGRFIPIAEETGLIGPIGEWVLQAACEQISSWQAAGLTPIRIAVNVAASQFHNGRIEDVVAAIANRSDISTSSLELEITERIVMSDAEDAIGRLGRLKALGVHLSIDDFGTGYSSLAYLRRLPLDKIKIDQTFVRDLASSRDAKTLVRAIIDLSHAFGFTVLAEGVETRQQALFLDRHRCDEFQGYLLAKPMPAKEFEEFLRGARVPLAGIKTPSARRRRSPKRKRGSPRT